MIYVAGALAVAQYWGYADAVAPAQLAWFVLFLLMAVLLFGSIFIAMGAACNDLKDSQNMMTPVMLVMMLPMITAGSILRAPDGMVAMALSLIPTATPFLMMLRIALQPGPPALADRLVSDLRSPRRCCSASGPPDASSGRDC